MNRWRWLAAVCAIALISGAQARAQVMPNFKEMSGSVLPVADLPAGTVSVRVIRGTNDKNVEGQTVELRVNGKPRTARTNAAGRAEFSGLAAGAKIQASATVDGERLESKEAVIAASGLRIILVATDPEAERRAEEDRKLAASPPVKGIVVIGPESRVIAQMSDDRLNIYYILKIVNSARTPVDIGGPLIIDLPRDARGSTILEGSTKQATANGPRITVRGPFPPGATAVEGAYELPYQGDTARFEQRWPAALQQLTIFVQQTGGISLRSPQVTSSQDVVDQGQRIILATGPGLAAGQSLTVELSGLPHRPTWPRNVALGLAAAIVAAGFAGAFSGRARRRAA